MSAMATILNGLGVIASFAYPPAGPVIAFLQKIEPYAEEALPIIKSAIAEGPAAFTAAKQAAPELFDGLTQFASQLHAWQGTSTTSTDQELATLASHIVGIDPPGWTHDETQRWWDKAQGTS